MLAAAAAAEAADAITTTRYLPAVWVLADVRHHRLHAQENRVQLLRDAVRKL